ncbi:hypothetical protein Tco_0615676, partial [Tanacetum coccineum]
DKHVLICVAQGVAPVLVKLLDMPDHHRELRRKRLRGVFVDVRWGWVVEDAVEVLLRVAKSGTV